mgnify:CR=1 FL=1
MIMLNHFYGQLHVMNNYYLLFIFIDQPVGCGKSILFLIGILPISNNFEYCSDS